MSVKDIAKLQQGQILELKKNPDEPVNLVVDDKVIGTGELVDIEGQLGVRILQLQGHGN
jgi:flagellar motor switch protein FliM